MGEPPLSENTIGMIPSSGIVDSLAAVAVELLLMPNHLSRVAQAELSTGAFKQFNTQISSKTQSLLFQVIHAQTIVEIWLGGGLDAELNIAAIID